MKKTATTITNFRGFSLFGDLSSGYIACCYKLQIANTWPLTFSTSNLLP